MVVQHNIAAMNASEANRKNVSGLKKKTEKLSTGYKINRAADNAAGLSISEKMRSQINGLAQATRNSCDAVSLIQTAEGGLAESEDIAQRMRELAVQAANGTYTDDDRKQIQYEIEALKSEVNRVAESTEFNTQKLLDGSCGLCLSINENIQNTIFNEYGAKYGTCPGIIDGIPIIDYGEAGGAPTTNGDFFNLFGNSISKTGHFQEELRPDDVTKSTSDMKAKYGDGDNGIPFTSVHMDLSAVSDMKKLIGTHFFVNCCTNCCPRTIEFTDSVGITSSGTTISVGLQKDDGTYFTDPAEFAGYIVDNLPDISHVEFACKDSMLYIYDVDNNEWDPSSKKQAIFCDDPVVPDAQPTSPPPNQTAVVISNVDRVEIVSKNAATVGGENAVWSDDGKTLTLNLVAGQTYDQSQINKIIENALKTKDASNDTAEVRMILGNGRFIQDTDDWYSGLTVPGVRSSSPRTDITSITAAGDYADKMRIVSNNYGQYNDLTLQLAVDVPPGEENVRTIDKSTSVLHLATGTEYTDTDIERILAKSGLDYDVILDDDINYDGSDTVMFDVVNTVGVTITATGGKSVGNDLLYGLSGGAGDPLVFQIGANGFEDQKLYVTIDDMRAEALGLSDVYIDPIERALEAIGVIDSALNLISTQRAQLGAVQNRLEHTVNSLNTSNENITSAESQIRDTDMAVEMTGYLKDNILQQASQAMLSQANSQTEGVLNLLGS